MSRPKGIVTSRVIQMWEAGIDPWAIVKRTGASINTVRATISRARRQRGFITTEDHKPISRFFGGGMSDDFSSGASCALSWD